MAKINIGASTVKDSLDALLKDGAIDETGHETIWWYYNHCQSNGWSQQRASKEIKRNSWTTLYRVFTGTYGAGYDKVIDAINRVRVIEQERAKLSHAEFIETSTYRLIEDVCNSTLIGQELNTVNGNSQIGKTTSIRQYIARNPDKRVVYMRTPACCGRNLFYNTLARACYLSGKTNVNDQRTRIKKAIDSKTLLIIDEAHQILLGTEKSAVAIMEYIREVFDECECGVLLIGTDVLNKELTGGKQAKLYGQLMMRGLIHARLPARTPKADIKLAADRFGYPTKMDPEAAKVIRQINESNGFGVILKMMRAGATLAKGRKQKPNWDYFVEAWVTVQQISSNNNEEQ